MSGVEKLQEGIFLGGDVTINEMLILFCVLIS